MLAIALKNLLKIEPHELFAGLDRASHRSPEDAGGGDHAITQQHVVSLHGRQLPKLGQGQA